MTLRNLYMCIIMYPCLIGLTTSEKATNTQKSELLTGDVARFNIDNLMQAGQSEIQDSNGLYNLAAAINQNICPIKVKIGSNVLKIDYRGVNLQKIGKIPSSKKFSDLIPDLLSDMKKKSGMTGTAFCGALKVSKMSALKMVLSTSEFHQNLKIFGTITEDQKVEFLRKSYEHLEFIQKTCGINEEDIMQIEMGIIKLLKAPIPDMNSNSMTECPWELCKSNEGTSTVYSIIVVTSTFLAIAVSIYMVAEYRKTRQRKKIMTTHNEPPIPETNKQKVLKIGATIAKALIILTNIGVLSIPRSFIRKQICEIEPIQLYSDYTQQLDWEN